jgi:hypothetical protein
MLGFGFPLDEKDRLARPVGDLRPSGWKRASQANFVSQPEQERRVFALVGGIKLDEANIELQVRQAGEEPL